MSVHAKARPQQSVAPESPESSSHSSGNPESREPSSMQAGNSESCDHSQGQSHGLSQERSREALTWVQAGRVAAIERFPYLDTALSAMIPVAVPGLGTVATDRRWRFYYDPQRTLEQTSEGRIDSVISDWVHEVGHQLRDHSTRWLAMSQPDDRHRTFNVAGDALINNDLQDLGLELLDTDVTFAGLPGDVHAAMTTEEVYFRLTGEEDSNGAGGGDVGSDRSDRNDGSGGRTRSRPPATGNVSASTSQSQERPRSSAAGESGQSGASSSGPASGGSNQQNPVTGPSPWSGPSCGSGASGTKRPWELPGDDDGSVPPVHGETIREATAGKVREHVRSQGSGSVPGGLRTWSEELLTPLVDWRRELRAVVSKALGQAAGRRDYSWGRSARRRIPGYILPGMVAPAPPQVAAVVDTSASMSIADLTQCLSDIASLTRSSGGVGVQVLPCDALVGPVTVVRSRGEVPAITLIGGGGTDMTVGIESAAALRPRPNVIITLTDGYTGWPEEPPPAASRAKYVVVLIGDPPEEVADQVPDWMHVITAPASGLPT